MTNRAIYLFDRDEDRRSALDALFVAAGYEPITVSLTGLMEMTCLEERPPLLVLGRCEPTIGQLSVVRALRRRNTNRPILVIADDDSVEARVLCLLSGASDCVPRSVCLRELLVRSQVLVHRTLQQPAARLIAGPLQLDLMTRSAERGLRCFALGGREFQILSYLMRRPGQIVSAQTLRHEVLGYSVGAETNTVAVHLSALRRKVDLPCEKRLLVTIRTRGIALEV